MVESFIGTDITMSDEIKEKSDHLDKGSELTMEDKANNIMNGGTGMTWMLSFMGRKLGKRKKHKGKISPSSSRMMRTNSIHHLECTDFFPEIQVGQTASYGESSKKSLSSDSLAMSDRESQVLKATHGSAKGKSGEACGNIDEVDDLPESHDKLDKIENSLQVNQIALMGKLVGARDALLKLKDINAKSTANEFANQSKLFLDTFQLFNANREAVLDAPEVPSYISPDHVERLQAPAKARMLTKSVSFPGLQFSGSAAGIFLPSYRRTKSDSLVTQETKFESTSSSINIAGFGSGSESLLGSHELRKRREAGTVLNRLRDLKEKIKHVITENRKEKVQIFRDRILHKVPFGHKLLEDMKDKKLNLWDDSTSERFDRGGEGRNFNNAPHGSYSKFARKSFQRSCSLTESLDKYSQMLKNFSFNEKGEVPENSISIRKDNGLPQGKLPKSLGRMLSSPVFRSYSFSTTFLSEVPLELSEVLIAEPFGSKMDKVVRSKSIREDNSLPQDKLQKNFGRVLSSPVFRSNSFSKAVQSEHYLESSQILTPESFGMVMQKVIDEPNTDAIVSSTSEKNDCEHDMVVDSDSLIGVEEEIRSDKFVTPTVESITEMIESQINPVSVNDNEHTEPSLFTEVVEEESDLVKRHEAQTEAESVRKPEKLTFISSLDLNMVEGSVGSAKYLLREGSELQPMPIKSDTLFEFVRYMLSNSEYGVLFLSPSYESATKLDTPFEQKLIYDLINEVLLEIYEYSTAPNPWLLHFHSKIRSMPVGDFLLQDVWNEVRWHLCAPHGLDATLDDLMAYDFAKNDWWMNLYRDAECVAFELEYLILDDLLDEAVVDSDGIDF